jgi:UDP-N-acetylglucosamine--dolichyl-phosphate N-acetylglucosaminephosphotransferase
MEEKHRMLTILIAFLLALVIVLLFMPGTIRMLKEKNITGIDVHKPDKPVIPKGAGFLVLFGIVFALLIAIGMTTFQQGAVSTGLLAALVSILMAGMIGLLDDNFDFKNRTKIALPLVASIPMVAMQVGTTTMVIPIIGALDLGILYPLIVVPLLMTFIIDSTNMYGGMNGLEAALATVNSSAVVFYLLLRPYATGDTLTTGQSDAGVVAAALLGTCLAFLVFNKYPAKVLPGDVGRLPIGATMAAALILGNMDRIAYVLYAPFLVNFLLYLFYRIHVKRTKEGWVKFASPREDGTLEVVGPYTLYWLLPSISKKITEKRNVIALVLIQAALAYVSIIVFLFGWPILF